MNCNDLKKTYLLVYFLKSQNYFLKSPARYHMAFKLSSPAAISVATPEELFRNFGKKKIPGLLAQQSDMLRAYMKQETESDVALELPTGSGKTLVGLLIAEWRRVARKERCLYLCPTRQLVNQVCEQAKEQYGLEVINFSGSARDYSVQDKTAFQTNQKIGVSTYSALFNEVISKVFNLGG